MEIPFCPIRRSSWVMGPRILACLEVEKKTNVKFAKGIIMCILKT